MAALGHFGDELFDNNVEHSAGGEAEEIGQGDDDVLSGQDGENSADGFDDAG